MKPRIVCPICNKKHFTIDQSFVCAELDIKEMLSKERRLKSVR